MILYIKNMVCPRCILSVESILSDISIAYKNVTLGQVELEQALIPDHKKVLVAKLKEVGFELLEDQNLILVNRVKGFVIEKVQQGKHSSSMNISDELSNLLNKDYSAISKLFSKLEGVTIERYVILQKVEKVKELLSYNEHSLYQIASEVNYSSTAHLSSQFKAITGVTPSEYKQGEGSRKLLDTL